MAFGGSQGIQNLKARAPRKSSPGGLERGLLLIPFTGKTRKKTFIAVSLLGCTFAYAQNPQTPATPFGDFRLEKAKHEALKKLGPGADLRLIRKTQVEGTTVIRYQQYVSGIEVLGGQAVARKFESNLKAGQAATEFDTGLETATQDTKAKLTSDEALKLALARRPGLTPIGAPTLKLWGDESTGYRLIYSVPFAKESVWIDAKNGEYQGALPHRMNALGTSEAETSTLGNDPVDRLVYEANPECQKFATAEQASPDSIDLNHCALVLKNSKGLTPTYSESASRAAMNASRAVGYFSRNFGVKAYNTENNPLISVVKAGRGLNNAFWDSLSQTLVYGLGDGVTFGDFTLASDLAGHEITHAYTEKTAGLLFIGESGALNEAFSDYFGIQIAGGTDWGIGRKVKKGEALRDLSKPKTLAELERYDNPCDSTNDYCGVHTNSAIASHAFYRIHRALGATKAEKLLFETLTRYLLPKSKFATLPKATLAACARSFTKEDCDKVVQIYLALGF